MRFKPRTCPHCGGVVPPPLSGIEATILKAIEARPGITGRELYELVYPRGQIREAHIITTRVLSVNRKIAPIGRQIVGRRGRTGGYRVDAVEKHEWKK